VHIV